MTAVAIILVLAAIVGLALWLWRDNPVSVHLQIPGARMHLETKGPRSARQDRRGKRRSPTDLDEAS
jgi:hypothetical protein